MTTQVILMNQLGIALASDSAVTAGSKVMNNSEKIFELDAPHKIAILTSSNASFMHHPWEVIFSAWSQTIPHQLDSTEEYVENLLKWLRTAIPSQGNLSTEEIHYIDSVIYYKDCIKDEARHALIGVFDRLLVPALPPEQREDWKSTTWSEEFRGEMTKLVTPEIVEECLEAIAALAIDRRRWMAAEGLSMTQARMWLEWFWAHYESDFLVTSFLDFPEIPGLHHALDELCATALVHPNNDNATTIALVGYGEKDLFPGSTSVDIHGVLGGTVIKPEQDNRSVAKEKGPVHLFYGQVSAINALVRGSDDLLTNVAVESQRSLLQDIYSQIPESDETLTLRLKLEESINSDSLRESIRSAAIEKKLPPFEYAIHMSPIINLAEFTAQLVGVQSAHAAMTQDNPTVGGPIDVAVITHRDGFEWIRHKGRTATS